VIKLVIMIVEVALEILKAQFGGKIEFNVAEALLDILSKAKAAYEKEVGEPLDVGLIKPYEPLE
jgi:hypothetical protein